jgi:hypothetical protein
MIQNFFYYKNVCSDINLCLKIKKIIEINIYGTVTVRLFAVYEFIISE